MTAPNLPSFQFVITCKQPHQFSTVPFLWQCEAKPLVAENTISVPSTHLADQECDCTCFSEEGPLVSICLTKSFYLQNCCPSIPKSCLSSGKIFFSHVLCVTRKKVWIMPVRHFGWDQTSWEHGSILSLLVGKDFLALLACWQVFQPINNMPVPHDWCSEPLQVTI